MEHNTSAFIHSNTHIYNQYCNVSFLQSREFTYSRLRNTLIHLYHPHNSIHIQYQNLGMNEFLFEEYFPPPRTQWLTHVSTNSNDTLNNTFPVMEYYARPC